MFRKDEASKISPAPQSALEVIMRNPELLPAEQGVQVFPLEVGTRGAVRT